MLLGKYCYIYYADANLFWSEVYIRAIAFSIIRLWDITWWDPPSSWNRIRAVMHRPCFCLVRLYVSGTFIFLPEIPFVSEIVNNMYSKWCKHIGGEFATVLLYLRNCYLFMDSDFVRIPCSSYVSFRETQKFIFMRKIFYMSCVMFSEITDVRFETN